MKVSRLVFSGTNRDEPGLEQGINYGVAIVTSGKFEVYTIKEAMLYPETVTELITCVHMPH